MLSRLSTRLRAWTRAWLILALFGAFAVYVYVTLPPLEDAPGGWIESLDTQLFYTPAEAFRTVASYGAAAPFWIRIYLTWDVVNPILYTLSLSLLISWLFQRAFKPGSKVQLLNVLPVGAGLSDVLENLSIVTLLAAYPSQPIVVAWLSTICTVSKMGFLALSLLLVLIGLVAAAVNGFRKQ